MQINIEKRHLYIIAALFILLAGVLVIAYGGMNPSVMGHTVGEIWGVAWNCQALGVSQCKNASARGWNLNQTVAAAEYAYRAISAGDVFACYSPSLSCNSICSTVGKACTYTSSGNAWTNQNCANNCAGTGSVHLCRCS